MGLWCKLYLMFLCFSIVHRRVLVRAMHVLLCAGCHRCAWTNAASKWICLHVSEPDESQEHPSRDLVLAFAAYIHMEGGKSRVGA